MYLEVDWYNIKYLEAYGIFAKVACYSNLIDSQLLDSICPNILLQLHHVKT